MKVVRLLILVALLAVALVPSGFAAADNTPNEGTVRLEGGLSSECGNDTIYTGSTFRYVKRGIIFSFGGLTMYEYQGQRLYLDPFNYVGWRDEGGTATCTKLN